MAQKCSGRSHRLRLAAAATLAVALTSAGSAFVGTPAPKATGGHLTATDRVRSPRAAASAAVGATRAVQGAGPSATWQVAGAAALLCVSAALARPARKSAPTGSRCRIVGCQAVPTPASAAPSLSAPPRALPPAVAAVPALVELAASETPLPAVKEVQQVVAAAPAPRAAPAAPASTPAALPEEPAQSAPLGAPKRSAARFVGGSRRRQHSASDRTARAARAARRSMGARLQPCAVAEPIVRSFDISTVRCAIQHGLKLDTRLHSRRSKDIKSQTNNKETCDEGVGISSGYFDNNEDDCL